MTSGGVSITGHSSLPRLLSWPKGGYLEAYEGLSKAYFYDIGVGSTSFAFTRTSIVFPSFHGVFPYSRGSGVAGPSGRSEDSNRALIRS